MGSKRPDRRGFLKSGAALAGGFTLGAAAPALGQEATERGGQEEPDRQAREGDDSERPGERGKVQKEDISKMVLYLASEDAREGQRAFVEKRKPCWQGR